jgi:hydroxyacylglutathione hydrolase
VIDIGRVRLGVLHTPGHTPEHLTFLVTDAAASARPFGAFTGDFLFVGDVGRPDLLQTALGEPDTAAAAASRLYLSVRGFAQQPEWLLLFPGHGAGSACGRRPGGAPVSSLGYEKLTNWAFRVADAEAFGRSVLEDQPDPPRYFAEMKRLNRVGAPRHRSTRELHRLTVQELDPLVTVHGALLDLRPNAAAEGYLPGSLAIPLGRQFLTHAGSLARYGMPIFLVAHDSHEALDAADALSLIGLDEVRGWIPESVVAAYAREGGTLERVVHVDCADAERRQREGGLLLDVRSTTEWRAGHMSGAIHAPLTGLLDAVREIDRDRAVVVYCQAGARSAVAATALRRVGFTHVADMAGGYDGYLAALQPVATTL